MDNDVNIRIRQTLEGNSLPEVKAQLKALQQEMNATNRTTAEGAARYKELSAGAGQLTTRLKELSNEQRGLSASGKGFSSFMAAQWSIISAAVTVAVGKVKEYGEKLWEFAKGGAEFGALRENFDRLSGGINQSVEDLQLLRSAVSGNMDDKTIMQTADKYKFLGLTVLDTARLLDGIEVRGKAMNLTFEKGQKAFEGYVMTGRDKGLRQLGINAAEVKTRFEELVTLTGKSVDMLDEEEIQSLRVRAVFEQLGVAGKNMNDILNKPLDNADKMALMETKWKNIKDYIAEAYSEQTVASIDRFNEKMKGANITVKENENAATKLVKAWGKFTEFMDNSVGAIITDLALSFHKAFNSINESITSSDGILHKFFETLKTNPNTAWVGTIIDGLKSIYNWAVDTISKILELDNVKTEVKQTAPEFSSTKDFAREGDSTYKEALGGTSTFKGETNKGGKNTQAEKEIDLLGIELNQYKDLNSYTDNLLITYQRIILALKERFSTEEDILRINEKAAEFDKEYIARQDEVNKRFLDRKAFSESITKSIKELYTPRGAKDERGVSSQGGGAKITDVMIWQGAIDSINRIKDIFTNLTSTLNIGADTFIGKMISGFDTVLGIMNTIMAVVEAEKTVSSFLSMLIPGMATGGLLQGAGTGTSDSILARVSHGEYVVNASATSQYLPFLNAINGGSNNLSNMFQRYANGGMVSGGNSALKVDMPEVKIKGSDIYLSWRRQGRKEAGRIG